jgi:hypothetical protein
MKNLDIHFLKLNRTFLLTNFCSRYLEKIFKPLFGDLGEYEQLVDQGKLYASKSFYDPINDQQVIVGWIAEDDDQGVKRG